MKPKTTILPIIIFSLIGFSSPLMACLKYASYGYFSMGCYESICGGQNLGGQTAYGNNGWLDAYRLNHNMCAATASAGIEQAVQVWPNHKNEIIRNFRNHKNLCQQHFKNQYERYAGKFC